MGKFKQWMQKNAHILMGLCVLFGILLFAAVIIIIALLVHKNTSASKEKSDIPSFYLGVSFSGYRGLVNTLYDEGCISDEEFETLEEMEAKAVVGNGDNIMYSKDVTAYMEYAMSLEGLKPYFQQYMGENQIDLERHSNYVLDKESFMEGFALGASAVRLEIWHDGGTISDKTYQELSGMYEKIFKNPTHQDCEEYVTRFNEIMLEVLEKEYAQEESNTQQSQETAKSGPLAILIIFRIIGQIYCFF